MILVFSMLHTYYIYVLVILKKFKKALRKHTLQVHINL